MRDIPGPVATLAELIRDDSRTGNWVWCWCYNPACGRKFGVALVPLVIRWGDRATIHDLNRNIRCAKCGAHAGAAHIPSWRGGAAGWQPFPVQQSNLSLILPLKSP